MVGASVDGSFPEGVALAGFALVQRPQVAEGIGTVAAPAHPALLQTLVDHCLTRRLDVPRADLPAFLPVTRVSLLRFIRPYPPAALALKTRRICEADRGLS